MTASSSASTAHGPDITIGDAEMAPFLCEAVALLDAGDSDSLIARAEARLSESPGDGAALTALAYTAFATDRVVLALDALRQALDAAPRSAVVADSLAILFALAGEVPEATFYAKLAVANGLDETTPGLRPAHWPALTTLFAAIREHPYLTRGLAALAAGDLQSALVLLEAQAAFSPNHGETQRALADALVAAGRPRQAGDILARFAANGAADGCDMARLARCLADCGESDAARGVIGEAATYRDEDAEAEIAAAALYLTALAPELKGFTPPHVATRDALVGTASAPLPDRPRVGILATALADEADLETVAVLAQGLRELGGETVLFGAGALGAGHNRAFQGRIGRHIDAAEFDPLTLAHTIAGEDLDLLLDAGGVAAPLHLAALAHHPAPRVAGWLNLPFSAGLAGIDRALGAAPPASGILARFDAAPRLAPFDDVPLIGADVQAGQLHNDLLATFAAMLRAVPDARLLLRDRELSHPDMVGSLIERFTALGIADRIEVVDADAPTFAAGLDLMVAPFAAISGQDVITAAGFATPGVALRGRTPWNRQGADALAALGLGDRVGEAPADLAAIAARLLADRAAARAATAAAIERAPAFKPAAFAAGLLDALRP
ncbi:tetratricopeptide repeat protein [Zavarzinia compransoris]|uniref:tetratricopeptide repeat protein n=1 Tax=Zavarzinia marina TaxID=2911065 RepID=UPI001F425FA5|nr:tetratricopeptide repeat protein [Zavarzinia marina]MCF4166595.1 tetratricopeptide repeat protein [Zavarzinia marina]